MQPETPQPEPPQPETRQPQQDPPARTSIITREMLERLSRIPKQLTPDEERDVQEMYAGSRLLKIDMERMRHQMEWERENQAIEAEVATMRADLARRVKEEEDMRRGWKSYQKEKRIKEAPQPPPEEPRRVLPGIVVMTREQEEAEAARVKAVETETERVVVTPDAEAVITQLNKMYQGPKTTMDIPAEIAEALKVANDKEITDFMVDMVLAHLLKTMTLDEIYRRLHVSLKQRVIDLAGDVRGAGDHIQFLTRDDFVATMKEAALHDEEIAAAFKDTMSRPGLAALSQEILDSDMYREMPDLEDIPEDDQPPPLQEIPADRRPKWTFSREEVMAYLAKVDEPDDAIWKRTMILADAERKLNEVPNVPILTRAQAMAEAERQMADQQRQNRWNLVHLAAVDCHNSRPMKMHPSAITHGPGEGGMSHLFGSSLPEIRIPAVVLATDVDSDDDDGPPPLEDVP